MKQKYTILKDNDNRRLVIQEYAELNKETMSLLCEETYENKVIRLAIKSGKESLISILRTKNLYPPNSYTAKIADAVIDLYGSKGKESVDLFFDDIELLTKEREALEIAEELEDESCDMDELLEDDFEDTYDDKGEIKKIDSSLKIADDDYVDIDDENE
ncbi:MAG: hypothetical protein JSV31_22825 [Desulfobacterales bacterium]|nr:MAG: hypothetical protein JSV31_22825 [Desulfobacterales bacterium]